MSKLLISFAVALQLFSAQAAQSWHGTVMGYYRSADPMAVSGIDFSGLTHVIHDHARPNSDGSLDLTSNGVTAQASSALIVPAHAAGVKVLLCVADTWPSGDFAGALNHPAAFINNIISLVKTRGYDGVDVDWENNVNWAVMSSFVASLKRAMIAANPSYVLTVAVPPVGATAYIAAMSPNIDIIDCLSYELFWWGGQTTWHNSPLYDGAALNAYGTPLYSVDRIVSEFVAAGVPASKLAIGAAFYGHKISGLIGTPTGGPISPLQNFERIQPSDQPMLYNAIVAMPEFQSANIRWDNIAQTPYLSVDDPINPAKDEFITYDNPQSIAAKANYVRARGLAGIFIWALPYDYIPANAVGQQHPLLEAVKITLTNLLTSPADITNAIWYKSGTGSFATAADTLQCGSSGPTSLFQIVSVAPNTNYQAAIMVQESSRIRGGIHLDVFAPQWAATLATQGVTFNGSTQGLTISFNSGGNKTVIFSLDANSAAAGATLNVSALSMTSTY